jgi:hypothetical protein
MEKEFVMPLPYYSEDNRPKAVIPNLHAMQNQSASKQGVNSFLLEN